MSGRRYGRKRRFPSPPPCQLMRTGGGFGKESSFLTKNMVCMAIYMLRPLTKSC
ncbi:hypothetical protein MMALV_08650 [Candidatus Methanomethylophilus alvi Mx1201]|uniref:Uncharacterized protein n=1 Tax=Methanomethylophilus alvi (strain Mx1201) TaxID=1236689 RepID=M9SJ95_METAX|nr:hypothetical protein MMALV_08650 [Candidatus Methanomethylophilus alvi Mx1201]